LNGLDFVKFSREYSFNGLYAAKNMGLQATSCTVVEDSVLGVRAGVAAGMRVLG
jgi:hypothetical protein